MRYSVTTAAFLITLSIITLADGGLQYVFASSGGTSLMAQATSGAQTNTTTQEKKDYLDKAQSDFAQLDLRIEALRIKLGRTAKEVQDELYDLSYSLEAKKAVVMQKIMAIKEDAGGAWKDTKEGLNKAMDDLRKNVDELDNRLR